MATQKKPASKKAVKETKKQPVARKAPAKKTVIARKPVAAKKAAPKKAPAAAAQAPKKPRARAQKKTSGKIPAADWPLLAPEAPAQQGEQQEKAPRGRPSEFTQEIADIICERVSDGESLRSICREEEMPGKATVFRWLNAHKDFRDQYARAQEEKAEALADEIVNIADEVGQPLMIEGAPVLIDGKPLMIVDAAAVNHARLRHDARKWVASKLKPKKYGDRIAQELSGPGGAPIAVDATVKLSAEDAYLRMLSGNVSE